MTRPATYCTKCGTPLRDGAAFCITCGAKRTAVVAPQPTPAPAAAPAPSPAHAAAHAVATPAASAATAVAGIAGVAGVGGALPWQTIVGDGRPDMRAFLSLAQPAARQVVQRSLRKPGLAMAATAVLDLLVAGITGGPAAIAAALPRFLGGGLTSLLSLITGTKGGALRTITGVVSLLTALVQVISLGVALIGGLNSGASLLTLATTAIATASALMMAVKTASVALRRRS